MSYIYACCGKYKIAADGSLIIEKADLSDGKKKYRCICKDEMDNESVTSIPWGQLIVTEPTTLQVPRIRSGSREHHYKIGSAVELYCIAQGYPVPNYMWFKQEGTRLLPLSSNRRIQVLRSTVLIHKASKIDTATYVCVANNSAGEDRIHLQLVISVTSPEHGVEVRARDLRKRKLQAIVVSGRLK
ncbi:ig-like domain-containing protein [Trichonephila inaurata madagascariensis]|uniref:Ig-like domain-containing protein n=1 Tax=Trichonephila inaurata madagascariensis TaxID=2747483 RepID=A0A8X7CS86_9ARAC|nr:ig-like domain-containing protein [Trichonephila inaurata madagascariensis]